MANQAIIIETEDFKISIEGNIFNCEYLAEHLNVDVAKKMVDLRHKHMGNKKILVFTDIRNLKSITKEARDFLSTGKAVENIEAAALLANSFATRLMFNFFLNFNKPPIPMKLFNKHDEAIKWLKSK